MSPPRSTSISRSRKAAGLLAAAAGLVALAGCEVKQERGDLINGKKLYVQKCGACHVLERAGSKGVTGPNLDQAFQQSLRDGFKRDTVRGVVLEQILYPARSGVMPAKLVTGKDAEDVAAYVAFAAAKSGKDTGALATAVGSAQKALAKAVNGTLSIPADPNGQLLYQAKAAEAPAGSLTLQSKNPSAVPHNIALEGPGVNKLGPVVQGGATSTVTVNVKPGNYTFFCSVPGHREGGMQGKLTVK